MCATPSHCNQSNLKVFAEYKLLVLRDKMYHTDFDAENKIWSGRMVSGPINPNITIGQAVLWVLAKHPNRIGQVVKLRVTSAVFWFVNISSSIY